MAYFSLITLKLLSIKPYIANRTIHTVGIINTKQVLVAGIDLEQKMGHYEGILKALFFIYKCIISSNYKGSADSSFVFLVRLINFV